MYRWEYQRSLLDVPLSPHFQSSESKVLSVGVIFILRRLNVSLFSCPIYRCAFVHLYNGGSKKLNLKFPSFYLQIHFHNRS